MNQQHSNTFYQTIADYYEYIFPLKPKMIQFTAEQLPKEAALLDTGCATGAFSLAISEYCKKVEAFDLNEKMISIAKQKTNEKVNFQTVNMLDIKEEYHHQSFDLVTCFGNTLVHLLSEEKILSYLQQTHHLLKENGKILLQILNYDKILDQHITSLPQIENEWIQFTRHYAYSNNHSLINFKTKLWIKSENRNVENSSLLYPIRPIILKNLILKAGFKNVEMFSSFDKEILSQDKLPLVIIAKK